MSTTFGIKVRLVTENHETVATQVIEVARRIGRDVNPIFFTDEDAAKLRRSTPVIAIDNSPQGIHTIGDLLDKIESANSA